MANENDLLSLCLAEISSRRRRAEEAAERNLAALLEAYPAFAELENEMNATGSKVIAILRRGENVEKELAALREQNLAVQQKRRDFIEAVGKDPDRFLLPQYTCTRCNDTGFVGTERCECLQSLLTAASCKRLNESSPLSLSSFDTFDLSYFDEDSRSHMENVLRRIRNYADTFSLNSGNLLFYGNTGLGKTHLSLAVANEVIRKGYDVVYGQAQTLFNRIADERFSRDSFGSATEDSLLACDLLIIDDLGAEFVTQMSQSVLYNILNTRLLSHKPMIVNTNIPLGDLVHVYHDRISSRLSFEFELIPFVGKDIRQKRKRL